VIRFTVSVKNSLSVPRFLVDQALARKGTTLEDYIDGGRKQGKTIEQIHPDLVEATGVDFTPRTLYRWVADLKVSA
jgi:hypothetical protein